jgi:hypothetical protein
MTTAPSIVLVHGAWADGSIRSSGQMAVRPPSAAMMAPVT